MRQNTTKRLLECVFSSLVFLFVPMVVYAACRNFLPQPGNALQTDEDGITPLMRAARDREPWTVSSLLKSGADVNAKDSYGWTAMRYAMESCDAETIKALISKGGVDVNSKSESGLTFLMRAAAANQKDLVKYLMKKGADVNATDARGNTALSIATLKGLKEIIKVLKQAGAIEGQPYPVAIPPQAQGVQGVQGYIIADKRPKAMNSPRPNYTEEARQHKISGTVYARILVSAEGTLAKIRIVTGLPYGLTDQAIVALKYLRFEPATKGGQAVPFWMAIEIDFNLK